MTFTLNRRKVSEYLLLFAIAIGLILISTFRTQAQGKRTAKERKQDNTRPADRESHADDRFQQLEELEYQQLNKALAAMERAQWQWQKHDMEKMEMKTETHTLTYSFYTAPQLRTVHG